MRTLPELPVVVQTLGWGGAEVYVLELCSWLRSEGVPIHIYTNYQPLMAAAQKRKIPVSRCDLFFDVIGDWKGLVKSVARLPWYVVQAVSWLWQTRHNPVVLLVGFPEKLLLTLPLSLFAKTVVWNEFAPLAQVLEKFGGIPGFWYRTVALFPNRVITSSQHSRRHLSVETGLSETQCVVVPCGVADPLQPLARFTSQKKQTPLLQQPHARSLHEVVCVSRLEKGKGQDVLIRAFKIVHEVLPTARLVLVGAGSEYNVLEQLVSKLNLGKVITLTGWVADPHTYVQRAQVICMPSVWSLEGFGLVTAEAMAYAKPVVAFDRGPTNELVVNEVTGLLARDGDVADLADKLITLLRDIPRSHQMGLAGRERYLNKYTASKAALHYGKVLEEVCVQQKNNQKHTCAVRNN
jgi:glycosyltransferase involved in cell wall biosynthesis